MSTTATLHSRSLLADLDTPVSAYLKLRGPHRWSFLFESVEGRETWASYSILGFGARRTFVSHEGTLICQEGDQRREVAGPDCLAALRQAVQQRKSIPPPNAPRFVGGVFGFLSYDAVHGFERLPPLLGVPLVPDACFVEPALLAVFDNRRHTLTLYTEEPALLDEAEQALRAPVPPMATPGPWSDDLQIDDPAHFQEGVLKAQEYIRSGDIIQAVLSRRFTMKRTVDPVNVYRGLRLINPSPYLFYFATPELALAGASPEVMIRVHQGQAIVRPIAGTRPRGKTPQEDQQHAKELVADPKERAEHVMLVDLGRNDVGRVSLPGSVNIPTLMTVERYSHVMHIVSEVRGTLAPQFDAYDALRAAFPAGTLSGAPQSASDGDHSRNRRPTAWGLWRCGRLPQQFRTQLRRR